MKRLVFLLSLGLGLFLAACTTVAAPAPTPDAKATETRIAFSIYATQTANAPTATPVPSVTRTPLPTGTPEATKTFTITPSPTITSTPRPTNTATATPLPSPTVDIAADKATYPAIDVRDLDKAPGKYQGQKMVLAGEVFNIKEEKAGTSLQIWVGVPETGDLIPVAVAFAGSLPGLYENDAVVVYGKGNGTFSGKNAYGGTITQPLVVAQYVDYGAALPLPPAIGKNTVANLQGKWEIMYVGDFRDKTLFNYFPSLNKTAMGVWVSIQLRIKNLQPGTDYFGDTYRITALDENGKWYDVDSQAASNAEWQYCGCNDDYDNVQPSESMVIMATFDVPEAMKTLSIGFKQGLGRQALHSPRFQIENVDQIPAWKPKK